MKATIYNSSYLLLLFLLLETGYFSVFLASFFQRYHLHQSLNYQQAYSYK